MKAFIYILIGISLISCKRHEINEYEINDVYVVQNGGQKKSLKSNDQFISILYADLYETSIPFKKLKNLEQLQASFGDKNVVIERIAQNFLTDPSIKIPSDSLLVLDKEHFISDTYQRFYTRKPTEAETWFIADLIDNNTELTVKEIYYGFITSEEYKYY